MQDPYSIPTSTNVNMLNKIRIVILFLLSIFLHRDMKINFVFGYLAELHFFHLKPIIWSPLKYQKHSS